jgi:hypothetical protein
MSARCFLPTYSRLRRSINFANAIPTKMNKHNTANMTKLFVGTFCTSQGTKAKLSAPAEIYALI